MKQRTTAQKLEDQARPLIQVICIAIFLVALMRVPGCIRDKAEANPPEKRIVVPTTLSDGPQVIDEFISDFDRHAVVIHSGNWEYVALNGAVFCRQGDKLIGVFNAKDRTWLTNTNQ